jgi:23S rRNA (uracil1939-C5)-methyltransferase
MSERTVTICDVSRACGACSRIEVPYPDQLAAKQAHIADLFEEVADDACVMEPIAGMVDPFGYRNKIVSPFAPGPRDKGAARGAKNARGAGKGAGGKGAGKPSILCGMYAQHSHRIIETPVCPVENEAGRRIIQAVRRLMLRFGIEPYNEDTQTGFMRHAVVRVGHESGEVLVTVVTNAREFPNGRNFARQLVRACPDITTVVHNVNTRKTNVILGQEEHVLFGPGFILDTLCGLSFRISAHSFYQVNAVQTEVLYRTAIEFAQLDAPGAAEDATVLDAYCGTGTIGLVAASSARSVHVIGVDKVESAIRDARQNARHNGIENAEFIAADAGEYMRRRAEAGAGVDVLLMDPPRAGASEEFLRATLQLRPRRIVYISCNPETQVRDTWTLRDGGYRLQRMRPVDMFPHTDHIENVVLLSWPDKPQMQGESHD